MSSTTRTPRGLSASIVRPRSVHFPAGASAKIRSNVCSVGRTSSASPTISRTYGGQSPRAAASLAVGSFSIETSSTSSRGPSPCTNQAQPAPTPVPSSRILPSAGTAAASTASRRPVPSSHEYGNPSSWARALASTTLCGISIDPEHRKALGREVRRGLPDAVAPALRLLPVLLAAERREVEEVVGAAELLGPPRVGRVRVEHLVAHAQEAAVARLL